MKKAPLYYSVLDHLTKKINADYKAGDIIPTQTDIAKETGTSLITVKRAINELVTEGLLETIAGKGTFVKDKPILDNHVGISSWTDSIVGIGEKPETLSTEITKQIPSSEKANILGLKARKHSLLIKRIRGINSKPICIMYNEIPMTLVPGMDKTPFDNESFYVWLKENYSLIPVEADEEVYAREMTPEEKKSLKTDDNIALIIKRISYLKDKTPFELSKIIAPAKEYRYKSKQVNTTISDINKFIKNQ